MNTKLFLLSAMVLLAGCSEKHGDLHAWMAQERNAAKQNIQPIEPLAPIEPVTYSVPAFSGPNAFSLQRMKAAYQNNNAPDFNRPKELLENYSLENLKYVGSIGSSGNFSGLIEVQVEGKKHIYTVKPGNYLGQHFGRITRITHDTIYINETVEDIQGEWVSRTVELQAAVSADSN